MFSCLLYGFKNHMIETTTFVLNCNFLRFSRLLNVTATDENKASYSAVP